MSDKSKWLYTMRLFDSYERRFAEARLSKDVYSPVDGDKRDEIVGKIRAIIGFREEYVPKIHDVKVIVREDAEKYEILQLKYTTWEGFSGSATYYKPKDDGKHPISFTLCGHGAHGRRTTNSATMARRLADLGFASIVPDNIGQGDREPLGHWYAYGPLAAGITLQGMIVMETVGLIRYMADLPEIDRDRMVACGNSGGGTLTLLLAALCPELSAIASTGYPSEFHYIFSKERNHCSCNLLPGIAYGPEMWEILSCFAPKPLLIEQGQYDDLIPQDYFKRCARKVAHSYMACGAPDAFGYFTTATKHPWDCEDFNKITEFLASAAGLAFNKSDIFTRFEDIPHWEIDHADSVTADRVAENLTGKTVPDGVRLRDIFPPRFNGEPVSEDDIIPNVGRGEVMDILAQMECALITSGSWGICV